MSQRVKNKSWSSVSDLMSLMSQWFLETRIIVNCPNPTVYIYMTLNSGVIRSNSRALKLVFDSFNSAFFLPPIDIFHLSYVTKRDFATCEYDLICSITSRVLDYEAKVNDMSTTKRKNWKRKTPKHAQLRRFFVISQFHRFNWILILFLLHNEVRSFQCDLCALDWALCSCIFSQIFIALISNRLGIVVNLENVIFITFSPLLWQIVCVYMFRYKIDIVKKNWNKWSDDDDVGGGKLLNARKYSDIYLVCWLQFSCD